MEDHYIILGCIDLSGDKDSISKIRNDNINIDNGRRYAAGKQTLKALLDLVSHENYISTWLVLGPIYKEGEAHKVEEIITEIDKIQDFKPDEITTNTNNFPSQDVKVTYKSDLFKTGNIYPDYYWKIRCFFGMDWRNIHDIEDNIHMHLGGNFADPFNPEKSENFIGKHHALAFFLTCIYSPDQRRTKLYVRSDDSIRVWLNGEEIESLKYVGGRDIVDYRKESCGTITLCKGYNILMAAVAESEVEWGFSARIEDDRGLRFTVIPKKGK
ncbi:hypothetical protein ACSAZK_03655 [Methanosarcina sp. Mfa9]|uniref:hypothetical protein n=1 Tax=Methanosarcina sp. Mfa9 TaxID=3439063 RepID=UPI003F86B965